MKLKAHFDAVERAVLLAMGDISGTQTQLAYWNTEGMAAANVSRPLHRLCHDS